MEWIDHLQWPAMLLTVWASWLVASLADKHRKWGFWLFMLSNVAWMAWGFYAQAYALVALQFALGAMNIRGARKARDAS